MVGRFHSLKVSEREDVIEEESKIPKGMKLDEDGELVQMTNVEA